MIYLATKTLDAMAAAIEVDQGALYRRYLGEAIHDVTDAYDDKPPGFRSHFGISTSGKPCSRALWYDWRWVELKRFGDRMLRLFNRGHLEEARFVAMIRAAGMTIYQADDQKKQYRVSLLGGHYGSALDGVVIGVPDLPDPQMPCLTEFKTHNEKSFNYLVAHGLFKAKHQHYVQMQQCMGYYKLDAGLYLAVCKNTDRLYGELIGYDQSTDEYYQDRSKRIIFTQSIPEKFSEYPDTFECKFCDHKMRCHYGQGEVARNCRTCHHGRPLPTGEWVCDQTGEVLDKSAQEAGCNHYVKHRDL
ncbi:MAG: hypothetical protein M0P09_01410 [Acholeplasmataceae bacterium]|nr:hypothetical protein [Acholeplasmataceae bacterium]